VNTYQQATGRLESTTTTSPHDDGNGGEQSLTRNLEHNKLGQVTAIWEGTDRDKHREPTVIGYEYDADGNTTAVT
ncbi:hypothetical protein, partial [Kitasatospora sp. MBT63]|uniref:hypothetical protein n=1 Tax=Kitasatospora sp. MBT63 TaxID=1444768 RepID=UPI00053AE0D6